MSEAGTKKTISGGKLLAIFVVIGAIITIVLVRTYVDMVERLNAEKEAELQAEYAAYDAAQAEAATGDDATGDASEAPADEAGATE